MAIDTNIHRATDGRTDGIVVAINYYISNNNAQANSQLSRNSVFAQLSRHMSSSSLSLSLSR